MRAEELLDAIGEVRSEFVADAGKKQKSGWKRWGALAAVLFLCIGLGGWVLMNIGGKAGGGAGSQEGLTYMSYEGPVFPLTLQTKTEGLSAERNVDYDFSPYAVRKESYESSTGEPVYYDRYDAEAIVTDSYLLTNHTDTDMTVTAYYPFSGNLNDRESFPQLSVDGRAASAGFHPGPYSGDYTGAYGAKDQASGSVNIDPIDSFGGYEGLLSDGSYLAASLDEFPNLTEPVIVYQMTDYVYSSDETAENPTLCMEFYADYDETMVLTYGINGFTRDREKGFYSLRNGAVRYWPDREEEERHAEDAYIILIGEDIDGYTLEGFRNGGCEESLPDLGCTVLRWESTLGEVLLQLLEVYTERNLPILYGDTSIREPELYCGLAAELMVNHGVLSEAPVERYEMGCLEDVFSSVHTNSRVFYLSFDVTVPAGKTVCVEAVMRKRGSTDFYGKGRNRDGYDMAVSLGSNLCFAEQSASLSGSEYITILGQNFGFDPENGVLSVVLNLNEPHYWMEVEKRKE